jgi:hypothetical protein
LTRHNYVDINLLCQSEWRGDRYGAILLAVPGAAGIAAIAAIAGVASRFNLTR